ncbi:MAG: hypothetical protein M3Q07_13170 [Pseudobdellovibrionaceae bacterium]|nr:hypothetical protein [Pseudobdellovibrionaceae bacterium]
MRKQKQNLRTLHPAKARPFVRDLEPRTLPWAYDMTGHALNMAQQLESVARSLSGMPSGAEREPADLSNIMSLFAETLQQVVEIVDEVRVIMEDTDPSIPKAVNG